MRIFSRSTLEQYWSRPGRGDAEAPLRVWLAEVKHAEWKSIADVRARFPYADYVGNDRMVFDIAGNKHRLIVMIKYSVHAVYVRFVGTHSEYNKVSATKV